MQKSYRFLVSALLLGAFLLSACSGALPTPGANSNQVDETVNSNDDSLNTNGNTNSSDDNSNGNTNANSNDDMDDDQEFFGVVEVVTDTSVTINGVTYTIADFTEFKDIIAVGDEVKIQVIVNADGTFTIREIELSSGDDNSNDGNSNSNTNGNSNDDNSNDDNSNDDNSNDDSNSNDDNSNDDDDNGDDNGGNDNDD